jgi:hypothetical protein
MTDDQELIARLRESQSYEWQDPIWETRLAAADRIEALTKERDDAREYAGEVRKREMAAEDARISATDKLATCERHRDAYAECDRIGTQAVRGLEAKLAKAVEALDEAVYLLKPDEKDMMRQAGVYRIVTTLAEIKGESHD